MILTSVWKKQIRNSLSRMFYYNSAGLGRSRVVINVGIINNRSVEALQWNRNHNITGGEKNASKTSCVTVKKGSGEGMNVRDS